MYSSTALCSFCLRVGLRVAVFAANSLYIVKACSYCAGFGVNGVALNVSFNLLRVVLSVSKWFSFNTVTVCVLNGFWGKTGTCLGGCCGVGKTKAVGAWGTVIVGVGVGFGFGMYPWRVWLVVCCGVNFFCP